MRRQLFVIFVLATLAAACSAQDALVPLTEKVAGHTQEEWSTKWWQWAASFEDSASPVADTTGKLCHLKQTGDVWFLAGTYEQRRTIRTCKVPAGKYLFFPLVNSLVLQDPRINMTCPDAVSQVRGSMMGVTSLVLELDGKQSTGLEARRLSPLQCFDLAAGSGGPMPSAASGYYIMLRPLSRGTHTLNFGGRLPEFSQAVTYTLHVE